MRLRRGLRDGWGRCSRSSLIRYGITIHWYSRIDSVKIPNISWLSNWPLFHCDGIEDVSLTMTIINCNKFWFSTQWAFFTEQFDLEAKDKQMRIIVLSKLEYLSLSDETMSIVKFPVFLCLLMSWSPDTRHCDGGHCDGERHEDAESRICNKVCDFAVRHRSH